MAYNYDEDTIQTLDWKDHIRSRYGMYIGALGNGSEPDDGNYFLLKEVIDNSIDEFVMGFGKKITIDLLPDGKCVVRDYGRGIPLGKVKDCVSKINTGGKYTDEAFQKSVGQNGVGVKAVNAMSDFFEVQSFRDGETRAYRFSKGVELPEGRIEGKTDEPNGTKVIFRPDTTVFPEDTRFLTEIIEKMCRYYSYVNKGLSIYFNGRRFLSRNGLRDLLSEAIGDDSTYPIIQLEGENIEIAFTYGDQFGEEYYSFANGQHTPQGGFHQAAFREAIVQTMRVFYKKEFEPSDVRASIIAAIAVKVDNPTFDSQAKRKLSSPKVSPEGETLRTFVGNFLSKELDNNLHKNLETTKLIETKNKASDKGRTALIGG